MAIQHETPAKAFQLSRRQFLAFASKAAGVTLLASCAAPTAAPQTSGGEAAPSTEKQQLIFWGHDQHPIDLAAEGYVELHPDVEWVSPHPADRGEKIVPAMAAGSGVPDLYWAEATEAQDWGCNALLVDLTTEIEGVKDQYHPLKLNEAFVASQGHYVGWPGDISVSGWYYREDKLAEAGFGEIDFETWTWNDFFEMAAALKEQGMYSFVFPASGWGPLFMFALHQLGGTAVSQDGQVMTVGDEKGIAAMQIVKQLWDSGGGIDVAFWSAPYWAALKDGELVADFAAAWARGFWEAQLAEEGSENESAGQWRIAKLPGGDGIKYRTGVWGGAQLVCPAASANPTGAIDFMKYALGSVEGAARCGEWGIIPSYRPYLESEEFISMRSPVFGDWAFNEFWRSQEQELSSEFYRPAGWGAVSTIVETEMVPILTGEFSVEDGMARIVELATPDFERTKCVA
jgi:lactose/L-arabinose transport system substrate-binding protein